MAIDWGGKCQQATGMREHGRVWSRQGRGRKGRESSADICGETGETTLHPMRSVVDYAAGGGRWRGRGTPDLHGCGCHHLDSPHLDMAESHC